MSNPVDYDPADARLNPPPGAARPKTTYHRDHTVTIAGFERTATPSGVMLDLLWHTEVTRVCKHCQLNPITGRPLNPKLEGWK
jgi:hypothetical protein